MKKIGFTGGGSSGHVTPNIAIIDDLLSKQIDIFYIGSYKGIEKELIEKKNIPYYPISSGKLRRYFSWENFIDPFKIFKGICQTYFILKKLKPNVIFSKGGFVTFPVAVAAKLNNIPVVCHESDFVPGLANKLVFPLVDKICLTFDATKNNIHYKEKIIVTGSPIRKDFFYGNKENFREKYHLSSDKKTILAMGGGLGSEIINQVIYNCLDELLKRFNIIHITGKQKLNSSYLNTKNYVQKEYINEEMFDAMALADLVISRAGSNTLYELILLKKKHILIPLSKKASRGDQIDNAQYFEEKKLSYVIQEEKLNAKNLLTVIENIFFEEEAYQDRLNKNICPNGTNIIVSVLMNYLKNE